MVKTVFRVWGAFETLSKGLRSLLVIGYFLTTEIFRHLFPLDGQWIAVWTFCLVFCSVITLISGSERYLADMGWQMRVFGVWIVFLEIDGILHTAFSFNFSVDVLLNFSRFENERRADAVVSIKRSFPDGLISLWLKNKVVALSGRILVRWLVEPLRVVRDVLGHETVWISFFFFIEYFLI